MKQFVPLFVLIALFHSFALSNPNPRVETGDIIIALSALDGNVITNTDFLEDPGHYNVYATNAEVDTQERNQRWRVQRYDGMV